MTARKERPDITLTALRKEPIERMLPKDATDAMEKDDPVEPMDMNEFREPILSTELVDPMLHRESLFLLRMVPLCSPLVNRCERPATFSCDGRLDASNPLLNKDGIPTLHDFSGFGDGENFLSLRGERVLDGNDRHRTVAEFDGESRN